MIFRLEYCNKFGDAVRVDIITPGLPTVVEVEGTVDPFRLKYTPDIPDKSFRFLTSSAEINIYETPEFNIDILKTSSETDIKVEMYINGVKDWIGFVIPDFFSKEIRGNAVVSMSASDRINTLKSVTLSDLPESISIRDLAVMCLAKTGLDLPLNTMVDFLASQVGFNDYFRSEILSQRLVDNKGRSISCYDILNSILVTSNSFLEQRKGAWYIVNKLQHEVGEGELYSSPNTHTTYSEVTHNFSEITKGAMRTIVPVAASVGVFHEHGGGRLQPDNYDFSKDSPGSIITGWNKIGGFTGLIDNRKVSEYTTGGTGQAEYLPNYGEPMQINYLVNNNQYVRNDNPIYLESNDIDIPYTGSGTINVEVDINATGPAVYPNFAGAYIRAAVVAVSGSEVLTLDHSGKFIKMPSINPPVFEKEIERGWPYGDNGNLYKALSPGMRISGTLEASDLSAYKLRLRIYGSGGGRAVLFNSVSISMKNSSDVPKGNLYKREQGSNFTKTHEIETSIFGDYITGGLNGYFYDYPIDDTSSLYSPNGNLRERWIDPTDHNVEELPLLQHVVRQKARMFSVAHDKISGEIEMVNFDPLAIFVDCSGKRYCLVSAEVDFLRSSVRVELEEIAYVNLTVRDYIYSYFGEGESGIKSVGGIASGTGGGSGVDLGIIGGINNRIDEVGQRMDDIKVGVSNLLRNTGFLGDFNSLEVDALTAVLENTPVGTNPLVHWVHVNAEVIDAPSRSGKGVRIGSLQQNVNLRAGEAYVLSFMAKGASLTVNLVDDIEVELTDEFKKYSFDIVAPNTGSFIFWITDPSLSAEVYEIMLSEGNTDVDYAYAAEDDLKVISQLQAINVITSVIKEYDTATLGGLILTSMIQLGKYKNGVMEEVNAGISGIYNNDDDPAAWFGGNLEKAIRTVQRLKSNPYNVSDEEWEELANIVFTHGGDGFFKGIIYALGGIFRGRIETSVSGNRIVIDPSEKSLNMYNSQNQKVLSMDFSEHPMGFSDARINVYAYDEEGNVLSNTQVLPSNVSVMSTSVVGGTLIHDRTSISLGQIQMWGYSDDGATYTERYRFEVNRNTIAEGMSLEIKTTGMATTGNGLAPGMWYNDNGTIKIKQ